MKRDSASGSKTGRRAQDRSRAVRAVELVVADPWRKLLALLLAVLLWYWLDRQVTSRRVIDLTPVAVDRDGRNRRSDDNELHVRLPTSRFQVTGFRDASSGETLEHVSLEMIGPKYNIGALDDALTFVVTLDLSDAPESGVFSKQVRIGDLRPLDREIVPLLSKALMNPPRIEVVIEHVEQEQFTLSHQDVTVTGPDPARFPNLNARLVLEDARFEPATVRVYGPAGAIERLRDRRRVFNLDLSRGRIEADQASGTLRLIEFPGSDSIRVADGVIPQATYPLRPQFEEFTLPVPVLLDSSNLPDRLRDGYRLVEPIAEVILQASGTLETLLGDKTEDQLIEWAARETRLVATVDPRQDVDRVVVEPLFVLLDRGWRTGLDYRVVSPPPITVERVPADASDSGRENGGPGSGSESTTGG